jgi:DNA-binding beta-propeller fold protein YncE
VLNLGCPEDGTDYFGNGTAWFNSEDFGSAGYVTAYSLDSVTGLLTRMAPRTITHDTSPFPIVPDPTGRLVYVGNLGLVQTCLPIHPGTCEPDNHSTSAYSIDAATGALTFAGDMDWSCSLFTQWCNAYEPVQDPTGTFAYLWVDNGLDLLINTLDYAGVLVPTGQELIGVGPGVLFFGPTGSKWVYITHGTDLSIYSFDPTTGALTAAGTTTAVPSPLTFDPTGKFGYAMSRTGWDSWRPNDMDTVQIFRIDPATGTLTLIGSVGT